MNWFFFRNILLTALVSGLALAQSTEFTKRSKNEVREGPGSYFRLMGVLPRGVAIPVLKHQEGWVNFVPGEKKPANGAQSAWMSKNCLVEKRPNGVLKDLNIEWNSSKASPSSIAAAVRGFAVRYGRTRPSTVDSLSKSLTDITPMEFIEFKRGMTSGLRALPSVLKVSDEPILSTEYDVTIAEEGVGLGIASRVASEGLIADSSLNRYVNLVAALLVDASGAYDTPMRVFVTKGESINAVSVPGGYIFITLKMVRMCHDESELAAVIAHEMTHILCNHGVKEIHQRLSNIRMDEAMDELDAEAGEQPGETIQDLDDFAIEAYEAVNKPRLLDYEIEADRGAAALLRTAGYDPMGVGRMLLSMRGIVGKSSDLDKENPLLQRDIQLRYDKVIALIQKTFAVNKGVTNAERFRRFVGDRPPTN